MTVIRKVVIPAAGWGTRFLPTTKAVPKELMPLVDRPVIHYGIEEAVAAGMKEVIIVTSPGKQALEDHFSPNPDLDVFLKARGKEDLLAEFRQLTKGLKVTFVTQEEQLGLGHAILVAAGAVGHEPFAVILPDDVVQSRKPALAQMAGLFGRLQASILAVEKMPKEQISRYGVIDGEKVRSDIYKVKGLVEKPAPEKAPSELAIVGRYILTPGVFDALREIGPGALGEIQVTDAIAKLLVTEPVYAYQFEGVRHDAGTPLGLIKASIAMALSHPEIGPRLKEYLKKLERSQV